MPTVPPPNQRDSGSPEHPEGGSTCKRGSQGPPGAGGHTQEPAAGTTPKPWSSKESTLGSKAQDSEQRHLLGGSVTRPDPETCDLTPTQHEASVSLEQGTS